MSGWYVVLATAESLDEEWEKDFDVEVTEQELQAAKERLKNAASSSAATTDDADNGKVCTVTLWVSVTWYDNGIFIVRSQADTVSLIYRTVP